MAQPKKQTQVTVWRAPDLGAELLRGSFADFSYDTHTHDTACFALLTHGAIRIRTRGTEFVARKGDLYAIAADEPHAGWPVDAQGWKLRTLYVDMDHLRALAGDERAHRAVTLAGPIIRDAELASMLYGVHWCSQQQGPALYREERYLAFASRLFARHARHAAELAEPAPPGKADRAVRLAKDFLDSHLEQQVSLGDIAAAAGLPAFRLFRAFERAMGMTPHAYQRQARIRTAVGLIRGRHALSEVAAAAGFADQAHLTRCFRRAMGVTPGVYQKAVRT
ncbi:helix-turn-helix domain-containing protein [Cupriavidus sp. 30B13]|uniref:AraC family transcriptional regulator n=1 Tax=Cupriavidus sp. 30B13 TaxID=3384241 RepID=UPI003B8F5640